MKTTVMEVDVQKDYSAVDNLEAMAHAKNYNAWLISRIFQFSPGRGPALDFGAGNGYFAEGLGELGLAVSCLEPDAYLRNQISNKRIDCYKSLDDIEPNKFPYLYSLNVIEHIADDIKTLMDLKDKLAADGRLYLFVPAYQCLYSAMDKKVGHFRRYQKKDLRQKLEMAGFQVEHIRYADFFGFWATLLFKALGNKDGDLNLRALILYDRLVFPLNRIFDFLFGWCVGKNLEAVAKPKPRGE